MIGYHYTSYTNWQDIQKNGLEPYPITNDMFVDYHKDNPRTVNGIWLWTRRFTGRPHIGSILQQFSTKNDTKIVYLKVTYYGTDQLFIKDYTGEYCPVELTHQGTIGDVTYHDHERHKSRVVVKPIPPHQIELIATYDLRELLK